MCDNVNGGARMRAEQANGAYRGFWGLEAESENRQRFNGNHLTEGCMTLRTYSKLDQFPMQNCSEDGVTFGVCKDQLAVFTS